MSKEVHFVVHFQISLLDADAHDAATNCPVPQPHHAVTAACTMLGPEVGSSCLYLCVYFEVSVVGQFAAKSIGVKVVPICPARLMFAWYIPIYDPAISSIVMHLCKGQVQGQDLQHSPFVLVRATGACLLARNEQRYFCKYAVIKITMCCI